VDVELHALLIFALGGGEMTMLHVDRFPPEGRATAAHWIDGQMTVGIHSSEEQTNNLPLPAIEQRLLCWNTWIFIVGILALFWHRIKSRTAQV